jgi:uncharacterized membrane protein YdjX (TVP38/TMEM64 family)
VRKRWVIGLVGALFALAVIIALGTVIWKDIDFRGFLERFGLLAPVIFILLVFIATAFLLPDGPLLLAGGFAFSLFGGLTYAVIGKIIGLLVTFYVGRKYGRVLVEQFVPRKDLKKLDGWVARYGTRAFIIAFAIPWIFPSDVLGYAAGIGKLSLKLFLPIAVFFGTLRIAGWFVLGDLLHNGEYGLVALVGMGMLVLAGLLVVVGKRFENK